MLSQRNIRCVMVSPLTEAGESAVQLAKKVTGGRKSGSANKARDQRTANTVSAKTEAAVEFMEQKQKYVVTGLKVSKHYLDNIIKKLECEYKLKPKTFNPHTIKSPCCQKNHTCVAKKKVSPVTPIEPFIVEWCLAMAKKAGSALNCQDVLNSRFGVQSYPKY
jgi:hypothetical protein